MKINIVTHRDNSSNCFSVRCVLNQYEIDFMQCQIENLQKELNHIFKCYTDTRGMRTDRVIRLNNNELIFNQLPFGEHTFQQEYIISILALLKHHNIINAVDIINCLQELDEKFTKEEIENSKGWKFSLTDFRFLTVKECCEEKNAAEDLSVSEMANSAFSLKNKVGNKSFDQNNLYRKASKEMKKKLFRLKLISSANAMSSADDFIDFVKNSPDLAIKMVDECGSTIANLFLTKEKFLELLEISKKIANRISYESNKKISSLFTTASDILLLGSKSKWTCYTIMLDKTPAERISLFSSNKKLRSLQRKSPDAANWVKSDIRKSISQNKAAIFSPLSSTSEKEVDFSVAEMAKSTFSQQLASVKNKR